MLQVEIDEVIETIQVMAKPWFLKCSLILKIHKEKRRGRPGWGVEDTALLLGFCNNYIYDSLRLALYLNKFPALDLFTSRKAALEVVRSKRVQQRIYERQLEIKENGLVLRDI